MLSKKATTPRSFKQEEISACFFELKHTFFKSVEKHITLWAYNIRLQLTLLTNKKEVNPENQRKIEEKQPREEV